MYKPYLLLAMALCCQGSFGVPLRSKGAKGAANRPLQQVPDPPLPLAGGWIYVISSSLIKRQQDKGRAQLHRLCHGCQSCLPVTLLRHLHT